MEICVFVSKIKNNKDSQVYYHKHDLVTEISLYCASAVLDWKHQTYHLETWMASSLSFFVYPGLTSQTTPSLHCLPTPLVTLPSHVITCPGRRTLHHLWSMNTTALMSTTREWPAPHRRFRAQTKPTTQCIHLQITSVFVCCLHNRRRT